jgi:homoserine O-acetyltransferase
MSDPIEARVGAKAKRQYDPPDSPSSVGWTRAERVRIADAGSPLRLECGRLLAPVDVEYEAYGELSPERDNVVVVAPALSGGSHAAGWSADADELGRPWEKTRPGWWDDCIGPGKAFDTTRYCVISASLLGGCYGSTGPSDPDPATGKPYGLRFPMVTVGDWVETQARLLDKLGVERIVAVAGGSLGGQQAIEWGLRFPGRVKGPIVLAASASLQPMGLALNVVAREAIMNDPHFRGGDYHEPGPDGRVHRPDGGVRAARMLGHISYLSPESLAVKCARRLQDRDEVGWSFEPEFQVESYLDHISRSFAERFDANTYLYITRVMDYYDAAVWGEGDLVRAAERVECSSLVVSFRSDWLYPPEDCKRWADALRMAGKRVTYIEVPSTYGHDAFLLEVDAVTEAVRKFLDQL